MPPAGSRTMRGAVCPRDPPMLALRPELCSPSVSLASISHRGRSDPDEKEPWGQRRVSSPGQSALCLSQGKTGCSSRLAQAGAGVRLVSWPTGCWAGAFATWTNSHTWTQILVVTNRCVQQSQPSSSLLVCVAQSIPVLPQIIHPSYPLTVLRPGILCKADGSVLRLRGIPTSDLMPPD